MMRRIIIPFILVLFLSFSCLKVHATCVNYSGGSGCDVDAGGGYIPEASGPVAVDTSSSTSSTTKSVHKASTVSVPVVPSTSDMVKSAVVTDVVGGLLASAFSSPSPPPGPTPEQIEEQQRAAEKKRQEFLRSKGALVSQLKGLQHGYTATVDANVTVTNGLALKNLSDASAASSSTATKGASTGFFGIRGSVDPKDAGLNKTDQAQRDFGPDVVDLRGNKSIVDPNDSTLGHGKLAESDLSQPIKQKVIRDLNTRAKTLGWSDAKIKHLNNELNHLDLDQKDIINSSPIDIKDIWDALEARSLDKGFAQDVALGQGPNLTVGAGTQTNQDCTLFALANATRLPYGYVAAQATALVRETKYHNAKERDYPEKTIEMNGLNVGEVVMLGESLGHTDVVAPDAFAGTLRQGKPVLVALSIYTGGPGQQIEQHEVLLTKTFQHNGATWYEMMNSNEDPRTRQYVSEKELGTLLTSKGVAYSPDSGTVVKSLK
jgi:hypothetical protein